jgi:uncharacterized membrane protein
MKMHSEILIAAPAEAIFRHAAATERWPQILPHYRFVRVLLQEGDRRIVEMAAWRIYRGSRLRIPVRWIAEQVNDAEKPGIRFRHLRGWTRGMNVEWRFERAGASTRVSIEHELASPLAPLIAAQFVEPIAGATLRCIKAVAEAA